MMTMEFSETALNFFLRESNAIEGVYDEKSLEDAKATWAYMVSEKELTLGMVMLAHKILMRHQDLMDHEKGYPRSVNVYVGGKRMMAPHLVTACLLDWCEEANKGMDPIRKHVEFEHIHPFVDGNGRLGRMIMNWMCLKQGKEMIVFTESGKDDYYKIFGNL